MLWVAIVLVGSMIWFFRASDQRGKTARLTADAWYYHAYLPSLVYDRDLDFSDEYKITKNWYHLGTSPTGRPSNVFGVGSAIFELPFFALGADITRLGGRVPDGFSPAEVKSSLVASLFFSLGALWFVCATLRRRFGQPYLAPLIPILLACAGPVVYYAIRQPGYAHPFATFWAAWLIDRWDRSFAPRLGARGGNSPNPQHPRSLGCWLTLGALLGLAALARMQLGLWGILFLPAVVDDMRRYRRVGVSWKQALGRQVPRWAAGAAVCFVCVLPQLLAWKALYGHYVVTPQGPGFMRWDSPAWSEVLFSSRNGLLPWAPLYALAGLGMFAAVIRRARLGSWLLIGVALQVVANGAAWDWWAGGSFGGRRFDSCFAAFGIGLGALLLWPSLVAGWRRWMARGAVGAGMMLSIVLAAGNLEWAAQVSAPTARIRGGQAAHTVLRSALPGPVGIVVARASRIANWPARRVFSWMYDTDTYDFVVGHHQLGELYPGLNSFKGKTVERLPLAQRRRKLVGFDIRAGKAIMRANRAIVLLGLNRRGDLRLRLRARPGTDTGELVMQFNGHEIARQRVSSTAPMTLSSADVTPRRGTNVLTVRAPPATVIDWVELRAQKP